MSCFFTHLNSHSQQAQRLVVEDLPRKAPPQALARPAVDRIAHPPQLLVGNGGEVGAPREVFPDQAVSVLHRALLPGVVSRVECGGQAVPARHMSRLASLDTVDLSRPILRAIAPTPSPSPAQAHDILALLDAKMPVAAHGHRPPMPSVASDIVVPPQAAPTQGRGARSENSSCQN